MAVSRALRRLLRVLEIEEEQSHLALKSAIGELRGLEQHTTAARTRERDGRQLVVRSAYTGELTDRLAGLEESRLASRRAKALEIKLADTRLMVKEVRSNYLAKRVERRQAEILIHEAETRDSVVSARRDQQDLDDWYLNRLLARKQGAAKNRHPVQSDLTKTVGKEL